MHSALRARHNPLLMLGLVAPPSQTRQSSYPGATTSTTSRISAIVSSSLSPVPKLSRAVTTNSAPPSSQFATYPAGSIISSASSAQAPPPAVDTNGYDEWRKKYGPRRSISSRMEAGSTSFGKGNASRDHGGSLGNIHGRNAMDHNDPDSYYFNTTKRLHHLDDLGSDEDEGDARSPPKKADLPLPPNGINGGPDGIRRPGSAGRQNSHDLLPAINGINNRQGEANPAAPDTAEGKERLEWQSMLKSVLAGDILQTESSRIGEDRGEERFRRELGQSLWWQIRAKMRGRSEEEEKRRVEERRGRVVDAVLEEVESFVVRKSPGPAGVGRRLSTEGGEELQAEVVPLDETSEGRFSEIAALDQVTYILQRLSVVEALYPHYAALRNAKPLYNSVSFRARVDALTAWSTVVTSLQAQLQILRKWTGSDDLDITRPNTTKEKALVGKSRYHPLDNKAQAQNTIDQAADDSTFLERIMKEDNLQRTFRKRALIDLVALVWNARETVVSHLPLFQELQLPDFRYELVRLIGFPGRLVIEALKVRLDAAAKLLDPNPMVINDMVDNFRLGISIAVLIKKQYEDMIEPDTAKHWAIPPCLPADFDAVMLDGLRTFFKLLHWKLKSGSRTIYFRETEVLEAEWEFLYETAEAVSGGDIVVAEHFW